LIYSTFLGGTNNDQAFGIAVDTAGNAYVTGGTTSPNFPNTVTNLSNGLTNNITYGFLVTTNAFLTQIAWNGTSAVIGYSAVFGGTNVGVDVGYGVAVDPLGNAFVCGATTSTNFPTLNTTNHFAATNSGGSDVFVTAFNTNGSALLYSVYLGGANNDFGNGIAVDQLDSAYVVGQTLSANFPGNQQRDSTNALHATLNGSSDAFLAKIFEDPPSLLLSAGAPTFRWREREREAGAGIAAIFQTGNQHQSLFHELGGGAPVSGGDQQPLWRHIEPDQQSAIFPAPRVLG
jgi:hypothetical protein